MDEILMRCDFRRYLLDDEEKILADFRWDPQMKRLLWQIYSSRCFARICLLQYGHR